MVPSQQERHSLCGYQGSGEDMEAFREEAHNRDPAKIRDVLQEPEPLGRFQEKEAIGIERLELDQACLPLPRSKGIREARGGANCGLDQGGRPGPRLQPPLAESNLRSHDQLNRGHPDAKKKEGAQSRD